MYTEEIYWDEVQQKEEERQIILNRKTEFDHLVQENNQVYQDAKIALEEIQKSIERLNEQIEIGKNTIINALNDRATIKSKMGRFDSMIEQVNIRKAKPSLALERTTNWN